MPSAQFVSLSALCLHYSSLTILMHLSRTRQQASNYRASSAVVITELAKLMVSIGVATYQSLAQPVPQPSFRASSHARFEPQFETLPEEEEEEEEEYSAVQTGLVEPRAKGSARSVADPTGQIHGNLSRMRQRTVSVEGGHPKRFIRGNDTPPGSDTLATDETVDQNRSSLDYSRRLSVAPSPRLPTPSIRLAPRLSYPRRLRLACSHLRASVFSPHWWLLAIPAGMFVVQNNLQYLAASNLSVPLFQITYQLKILTTALCSVFLLKRSLKKTQWISLVILTAGVAIVQLSSQQSAIQAPRETITNGERGPGAVLEAADQAAEMNQILGLIAVIAACLSSGFASVYLERIFKSSGAQSHREPIEEQSKKSLSSHLSAPAYPPRNTPAPSTSIWIKNVQLSGFGLLFSLAIVLLEDHVRDPTAAISGLLPASTRGRDLAEADASESQRASDAHALLRPKPGFFVGFTQLTWLVILFQVAGGILNAFVIKYSTNIHKNFSICLSIILSIGLTNLVALPHHQPDPLPALQPFNPPFILGSFFVLFSTWLFSR